MHSFTISCGQMECDLHSIEKNENKIVEWIKEASNEGSSLLVLPELSLTGYRSFEEIKNLRERQQFSHSVSEAVDRISRKSYEHDIDVLLGFPLFCEDGVYIASAYIEKGTISTTHKKINLCNYAHYVEHLHFDAGSDVSCVKSAAANFGIIICEDSWHMLNSIIASQRGAEVLLNPSAASVGDVRNVAPCVENWMKISTGTAFLLTSYFVLCNQAGNSGEGCYMGGSHIVDPAGKIVMGPLSPGEQLVHERLNGKLLEETRAKRPLIKNERMDIYAKYFIK